MSVKSLYVHIPFCMHICSYCDFCKVFYKEKWADDYLMMLEKELNEKRVPYDLKTIYIGGGTPTALSLKQLEKLMDILKPYSQYIEEYTIEMNPETVDQKKLMILKNGNVNRLSIGVQTFQDHLLKYISRHHCRQQVFDVIDTARQLGFDNISVDLMYGLPHQTKEDIKKDIQCLYQLSLQHVSYYSLILEDHTILSNQGYKPLDEQEEGMYYEYIENQLARLDLQKYEVSNFAKKGYESKHNQVYWQYDNYIGAGIGAHGLVDNIRYENTRSLTHYLNGQIQASQTEILKDDAMFEMIMMSLRMKKGLSLKAFESRFCQNVQERYGDVIDKYCRMNMLCVKNGYLKTTQTGMLYLNEILIDFL